MRDLDYLDTLLDLLRHFRLSKADAQIMAFISFGAVGLLFISLMGCIPRFQNKPLSLVVFLIVFAIFFGILVPFVSLAIIKITKVLPKYEQ